MWFYFYGVFFILVSNISLLTAKNATENDPKVKAVFADVVKNITRVNNVLEDLIKNYEKLKKIYESEESVQKEESSETEIDELYKKYKEDKEISRSKQESTTTGNPSVIVTQMFLSAEEFRKENEINIDNSQEKERTPKFAYLKEGKVESSDSDSQNDSYTDETSYSYDDEDSESDITDNDKTLIMYRNDDTKQPEKYYNLKRFNANTLTNGQNKDDLLRNNIIQLTYANESKPIFKLELSDVFSKNAIQNDFMNKQNNRKESGNVMIDLKDFFLTRKKMNTVNTKKSNKTNKLKLKATNSSSDLSSLEDNKSMEKEQFKTKVLRSAYGDACLKLVVRKCHKACKAAIKSSCNLHKCKSNFKSAFNRHSRRACVNQFTEPPNNMNTIYRNGFSDMTENGYIAAACLPVTHERTRTATNNDTEKEDLNILRDRFERACQKISSEKCNAACAYAVSESCASYPCFKNQGKIIKKSCKNHCKSAYEYRSKTDKKKGSDNTDSDSSDYDFHTLKKEIRIKKNKKNTKIQNTENNKNDFEKIGSNSKQAFNNNTNMVKVANVTSPNNVLKTAHF